jgi:hypothetical protein
MKRYSTIYSGRKHHEDDYDNAERGICSDCGHECIVTMHDHGFSHAFGYHHDWQAGSSCCGEEVIDGGCALLRVNRHVARKEHHGERLTKILPGDTYEVSVYKHWKAGGPSWITSEKRLIKRSQETEVAERIKKSA